MGEPKQNDLKNFGDFDLKQGFIDFIEGGGKSTFQAECNSEKFGLLYYLVHFV